MNSSSTTIQPAQNWLTDFLEPETSRAPAGAAVGPGVS